MNAITIFWIIFFVMVAVLIAGITYFVWWWKTYKIRLTFKKLMEGNKIVIFDRAREYTDKEGGRWWKLHKTKTMLKNLVPIPESECIEVSHKGKPTATGYLSEEGQVAWQRDKTSKLEDYLVEPIKKNERTVYVQGITEAANRKRGTWQQQIPQMFALGLVALIIVMLLVFWGDLADPILDKHAIEAGVVKDMRIIREDTNANSADIQIIKAAVSEETPPG